MKRLYLVRHAKSSWDSPALTDFERPLNHRGERDAPKMGEYLATKGILPETIFSSPANRALTTAKIIAEKIGYSGAIDADRRIYHANEEALLEVLSQQGEQQEVMMFGHNPGFTDFANELANEQIDNIPTCGVCSIDLDIEHWSEVSFGAGTLIFFQYPKGLS